MLRSVHQPLQNNDGSDRESEDSFRVLEIYNPHILVTVQPESFIFQNLEEFK